jgi:dihydropteroate synthase
VVTSKFYIRPTGFVDAPFGHDGKVARLAGGLTWFSAVEMIGPDGGELAPVAGIEARLDEAGQAIWANLIAPRAALQLGERVIRLDQPQVAGIVNVTPDSFADGGRFPDAEAAIEAGHRMAAAGAALIDVGGESTRPGAKPVWEGDETERVLPVIKRLAAAGTAVSVDTRKAAVMAPALAAGAAMINDVSALTWDPRAAEVVAKAGCPIVLMHHKGDPATMQDDPRYERPVLLEVYDWLEARIAAAVAAGIARDRIIVDPGFGFGKTVQHNLQLMNGLALLHGLGCPIMLGASRKRAIGALSNEAPAADRLGGSIALALKGVEQGVQLLRVHDIPETLQAIRVWRGLRDTALTPG